MSATVGGKYLFCDGKDCHARALAPVALRSFLHADPEPRSSTQGWLFVQENARTRHFCPHCASCYLKVLTDSDHSSADIS